MVVSAHDLTKTHFCAARDCEEEVRVAGGLCARHVGTEVMRCKDPDCAEVVTSNVGPYSYCKTHRDERGIPTGAGGTKQGSYKKLAADGETHESRLRNVLAAARALDRAEAKAKKVSADLSKARKAHRDALIAATSPHGVTHEADA